MIVELLDQAEAELDAAVHEAYAEGYKAAMLTYVPQLRAYQETAQDLRTAMDQERKKHKVPWQVIPVTGALLFAAGVLTVLFAGGGW